MPLLIHIGLGISGLVSSHLFSLLTIHTICSPGLSHSFNFHGHMAFSIPFLDPISYPFPVPEALSLCFLELTGSHQQDPLYPWPPLWMPLPSSFSNQNLAVPWGHHTPAPDLSRGGCFLPAFLELQSLQVGWVSLFLLFTISSPLFLLSSSVKLWALNHTKSDCTNSPSFWEGLGFWLLSFSITTVVMILGKFSIHTDDPPIFWLLSPRSPP